MTTLLDLENRYFVPGIGAGGEFSSDSHFEPLIDGMVYFARVLTSINATAGPGDAIYILTWELQLDWTLDGNPASPTLGQLLVNKAEAGVDVRVVVNGNVPYGEVAVRFNPFATNWESVQRLKRMRGSLGTQPFKQRVCFDWSGANLTGSQHQKMFVIRSAGEYAAYVSGMNLSAKYRDSRPHHVKPAGTGWWGWHDIGARVTGAAVDGVYENFRDRWNEVANLPPIAGFEPEEVTLAIRVIGFPARHFLRPRIVRLADEVPLPLEGKPADPLPLPQSTGQAMRVLRSRFPLGQPTRISRGTGGTPWANGAGRTEIHATLRKAIAAARTYIYIEDQFLGNSPAAETIPAGYSLFEDLGLALAANPELKLILVGSGRGDPDDPSLGSNERNKTLTPDVKNLVLAPLAAAQQANVAVWRLENATVHSKLVLIDDEFLSIGSCNFQSRSFYGVDSELQVVMVTAGTDVRDFRVQLWAEHLRLPDPALMIDEMLLSLQNMYTALGIWRSNWADSANTWWRLGAPAGYDPARRAVTFVSPT